MTGAFQKNGFIAVATAFSGLGRHPDVMFGA